MFFGKVCLLFVLLLVFQQVFAWSIGSKGRTIGPSIHTTYFLTPNNQTSEVHTLVYMGYFVNNSCQFRTFYDLGTEKLTTGDFLDINAFWLRDLVGSNYSCMTIYYNYRQSVYETLQLFWDGNNYYTTNPSASEVTIL